MIKFLFSGNGSRRGARYACIGHTKSPSAQSSFCSNQSFIRNPIDSFVLQNLKELVDTERTCGQGPLVAQSQPGLDRIAPDRFGKSMPFSKMIPRTPVKRSSIDCLPHPVMESIGPGSGWIWPAMPIPTVFKPINSGQLGVSGLGH